MRRVRSSVTCLVVLLALMVPACRVGDLSFRQDERVEIVEPEQRSTVTLPFRVRWTVNDFAITGPDGSDRRDAGYFALLMDTSPMPPGESLAYFARDDETCQDPEACVEDDSYLADRNVHLTEATSFQVTNLRDTRPVDRPGAPDRHELTIILLNGRGERIGESAFRLDVVVERGRN